MDDSADDDPIARAVLSEDPDRRLRVENWNPLGRYDPPTKLRVLGATALGAALVVGALGAFRADALGRALGVTKPLSASVAASFVLAVGLKYLTIGGVGIVAVDRLRRRRRRTEARARRLLGIEETMWVVGLVIGGLGTLVGVGLVVALAVADPAFVRTWLSSAGDPVPLPFTYRLLVGWAALLGVGLFGASAVAETPGG